MICSACRRISLECILLLLRLSAFSSDFTGGLTICWSSVVEVEDTAGGNREAGVLLGWEGLGSSKRDFLGRL